MPAMANQRLRTTSACECRRARRSVALFVLAAVVLAASPDDVHAQIAEADVFVAKAIVAYDEKRGPPPGSR
jgi:hypothetical protein